eukprot:m.121045 g.121045  ORF g.121045 m.121045 type:complete len:454 (+) comp14567_c3_seq3:14-1375(+)
MPTLVLVDVSLSMARPARPPPPVVPGEPRAPAAGSLVGPSRLDVAKAAMKRIFNHMALELPCESTSLISYSSECERMFDYVTAQDLLDLSAAAIERLGYKDKTIFDLVIMEARKSLATFGPDANTQIILLTESSSPLPMGPMVSCQYKLHVVHIGARTEASHTHTTSSTHPILIDAASPPRHAHFFYSLETGSASSAGDGEDPISTMLATHFRGHSGSLSCGALTAAISLLPPPSALAGLELPIDVKYNDIIHILGFVPMSVLGSPPAAARHVVLPPARAMYLNLDQPDFRTLLHGGLKTADFAAVVRLGPGWHGLLHSWTEQKKSNVVLLVLPPGAAVPWLGSLDDVTTCCSAPDSSPFTLSYMDACKDLLVRPDSNLQSDIQRLLRLTRTATTKRASAIQQARTLRDTLRTFGMTTLEAQVGEALQQTISTLDPPTQAAARDIQREWDRDV